MSRKLHQMNDSANRPTKVLVEKGDQQRQTSPLPRKNNRRNVEGKKRNASSPLLEEMPQEKKRVGKPIKRQLTMQEAEDQQKAEMEPGWQRVEFRKEKKRKSKDAEGTRKNPRKQKPPKAVALKTKTLSYLEALTSIKSKVDPDKIGVKVSGIRQTRGGEILIEIKGGSGGVKELRGTLVEALGKEATMWKMGKAVTLDVRDIDAVTRDENVETAIKDTLGENDPESVKVQALRKGFG